MSKLIINNLNKFFQKTQVLFDININVKNNEFIVLVGPSGCGKTTLLRSVAGLESINSGEIKINDKIVNNLPPKARGIALVFQNYALYPHMTVFDNLSFGLKINKVPKLEIEKKVSEISQLLGITDLLNRKPSQISGGQKQRVAMGRAIIKNPELFLFDEPLSNLDAKLRNRMRIEIKKLHKKMQSTSLYVTHDQIEAMTLADRIVVMNKGKTEQIGSPLEVYHKPKNIFVAQFIGTPSMNLINLDVIYNDNKYFLADENKKIIIQIPDKYINLLKNHNKIILGIRANNIILKQDFLLQYQFDSNDENLEKLNNENSTNYIPFLKASIEIIEPVGDECYINFDLYGNLLKSKTKVIDENNNLQLNGQEEITFNLDKCYFFDYETQNSIQYIQHE